MPEVSQSILAAAQGGDRDAISVVVRVWHRPVRAYVATMLLGSHDADDVAQEVFLRALDRLHLVESVDVLGAYLKGVARNVVREQRRKYARENRAFLRLVEERCEVFLASEQAHALADPEVLSALRSCLSNLPEQSRQMLAMKYTDQQTSREIGETIGMNPDAVRTAMRRARISLLKCIQTNYQPAAEIAASQP